MLSTVFVQSDWLYFSPTIILVPFSSIAVNRVEAKAGWMRPAPDCLALRILCVCVCICICMCIRIPPVYVYLYFLQLLLTELKLKLGDEVSTRLFSFEEMQRTSVWATKASSLYFHCPAGGPKASTVFHYISTVEKTSWKRLLYFTRLHCFSSVKYSSL